MLTLEEYEADIEDYERGYVKGCLAILAISEGDIWANGPYQSFEDYCCVRWRFKKANAQRVPAYMIFNDATLGELARVKPRTHEELLDIKGIGPSKARRLGKETLSIIAGSAPQKAEPVVASLPVKESSGDVFEDDDWSDEEFNG